ncbi:hypothetical protein Tco_0315872 [Tanacetum coccineum]
MDVPPSPDRVFDFPVDEPHPAYNFFAPGSLPDYAGNPNNTNEWIEAYVPLLGEAVARRFIYRAAEGHSLTLLAPGVYVLSSVIEDLCTRMDNLEHGHGALVKKMMTVSDAEVADSIAIGTDSSERLLRVVGKMEQDQQATTQRDEVIFGLSQQVQTLQTTVQDRDFAEFSASYQTR